jgi:hypothetical protein
MDNASLPLPFHLSSRIFRFPRAFHRITYSKEERGMFSWLANEVRMEGGGEGMNEDKV